MEFHIGKIAPFANLPSATASRDCARHRRSRQLSPCAARVHGQMLAAEVITDHHGEF